VHFWDIKKQSQTTRRDRRGAASFLPDTAARRTFGQTCMNPSGLADLTPQHAHSRLSGSLRIFDSSFVSAIFLQIPRYLLSQ
jgi:hypothetical protein